MQQLYPFHSLIDLKISQTKKEIEKINSTTTETSAVTTTTTTEKTTTTTEHITTTTAQATTTTEQTTATTEKPKIVQKEYGPGIYVVGDDIEPGIYRSEGGVIYFARLSGFSGELDDILANGALPSGPVYVEIKSTDAAFKTEGSGKWRKINLDEYIGAMLTSFGDGWYIVGKDIMPGKYRSNYGCTYWARLKGFSGELNSIIANSAMDEGTVIIEIKSSDFGFQTQGAKWEKIN